MSYVYTITEWDDESVLITFNTSISIEESILVSKEFNKLEKKYNNFILDITQCKTILSTMMGIIVTLFKHRKVILIIKPLPKNKIMRKSLEICGITQHIPIVSHLPEALQKLETILCKQS